MYALSSGALSSIYEHLEECIWDGKTGFTVELRDGTAPTQGYAVGIGNSRIIRNFKDVYRRRTIPEALEFAATLPYYRSVGGWVSDEFPDDLCLDEVQIMQNYKLAVELATEHGEKAIYDLGRDEEITIEY